MSTSWQDQAAAAATVYGIDPPMFVAQISAESGGDPNAVSKAGCQGIAQICDAVPFNPFDVTASLQYAANRMAQALQRYGGNYSLALASYNCGVGCADKVAAGKQNLPAETVAYIQKILGGGGAPATSGTSPASSSGSSSTFAPTALSAQVSTLVIVFAALVLLVGMWAMTRGGTAAA